MATLRPEAGTNVYLHARTLVGRREACELALENRAISGEHAVLVWDGGRWWVRDLASRNGTWLDGQMVEPGTPTAFRAGQTLAFGTPELTFQVIADGPPEPVATAPGGEERAGRDGLLALPDDEHPEITIALDGSSWVVASGEDVRPVAHGDSVVADGTTWTLRLPTAVEATLGPEDGDPTLVNSTLLFRVSRDEEHVELSLDAPGGLIPLGARQHHYLLLTLARLRRQDAALPGAEQGWVHHEDLSRMLRLELNMLHTHIFRARRQFADAGVVGATALIERRPSSGQLRLGSGRVSIETA